MNTFKHSGTFGDLIYSLPIVKHFGGGEFYLHLGQINWIGQHYYGSPPQPQHQGRMTEQDLEFLKPLMLTQPYISKFESLTQDQEITHNLDRFRPAFVRHPGNYVDIYSTAFGIRDPEQQQHLRTQPWITIPNPQKLPGKTTVINRTARWLPRTTTPKWIDLAANNLPDQSIFVGTPEEYQNFMTQFPQWHGCDYYPTQSALDLAEIIAGADQFIGNQSLALSLAIGMGQNYIMEARDDLPLERNECWFPDLTQGRLL